MTTGALAGTSTTIDRPLPRKGWRRAGRAGALGLATIGVFLAYLRMSRTWPMDSDGASQALQAWDLLHGNVLLANWTLSDVSFYTFEVPILAVVEAIGGLNSTTVHAAAAAVYTLLVLLVAALARGRASGREAVARVVIALAVMAVPAAGRGTAVLLGSPDHTGTAAPLLLALLLIDRRAAAGRWLPYAVGLLLLAGQVSDPLMVYIGVLPVAIVCALRLWRGPRSWRRLEPRLLVAVVASVIGAQLTLIAIRAAGGFRLHAVPAGLASPGRIGHNLEVLGAALAADFGAYFPDRAGNMDTAVGVARLLLLALTAIVVGLCLLRLAAAGRPGCMVDQILVVAIAVNLAAFVGSTIPFDVTSARQVAAAVFLGAAVVGRTVGPRLASLRWAPALLAALLLVCGGEFVARVAQPAAPEQHRELREFLVGRNLTYGLGGFWTASELTVATGGRVHVVPVTGRNTVYGYQWLSRSDWYDPGRHDARFIVIDAGSPEYGTVDTAVRQFGPPRERREVGPITVLIYDRNLLVGLPGWCLDRAAPSMAECP